MAADTDGAGALALHDWLVGVLAAHAPGYAQPITEDTSLVEDGLCIDSVGLIEVVAAIEKRLGVVITEDDIQPKHFATLGRLLGFLAGRLQESEER